MESFASPIRIPVVPASVLHRWLVAGHIVTFAGLIWFFPFGPHAALLEFIVAASLILEIRSLGTPNARCQVLLLGRDDVWSCVTPGGERIRATLLPGFFVSTRLVILRVKPVGARPLHVVLTGANTPPGAFRRLRVRLKYTAIGTHAAG